MMLSRPSIPFRSRRRGAVLLPDLITALAIVALLLTVLAVALGAERRAERRLGDQLRAVRSAEAVLTELQQNHSPTISNAKIDRIAPGWVRVTISDNGIASSLIGPVEAKP
jgi:Tfp pilus assembly protein PilX